MAYLDNWRMSIPSALEKFMPQMGRKGVDLKTGVLAAAVLWYPRDAHANPDAKQALIDLCGHEPLHYLLRALPLDDDSELATVQMLMQHNADRPMLREAIDKLIRTFIDEIVAANILKQSEQQPSPSAIRIEGNVEAGIVNIGGTQYFWGDVTVHVTQVREVIRTCPKPPNPPENFGGREAQYQHLKQQLQAGETSAIAGVQGVGGIGKTTLARQLAHDLYREQHFKAVVWTDVNQTPDTRRLLVQWGQHGDKAYAPDGTLSADDIKRSVQDLLEQAITTACNECESPHVLVVLDDVWDDGLATARTLLDIKPQGATVLVTTRSQEVAAILRIGENNLHNLEYLRDAEAVAMLSQYDWLAQVDEAALIRLCAALGGHPLALDLAARRIRTEMKRSGGSVAKALNASSSEYEKGIPADTPFAQLKFEVGTDKVDNLTLSLRLSYDALSDADKSRFRALGVLPVDTPFDVALLGALWQVTADAVEDHCDTLRELALLDTDEAQRAGWYQQHRLLRAIARALLRETGETDAVFLRYARHMTDVANQFKVLPLEDWHNLNDQLPHIHFVGNTLAQPYTASDELAEVVGEFSWNTMRYLGNRLDILFIETDKGREPQRIQWFEMGLSVWQKQDNKTRQATTLNNIGEVYRTLGDNHKALDHLEQALPILRQVGNRGGEASTLNNIGAVWYVLGEKHKALDHLEQALPILRQVGNRGGEASTLNNIGEVYRTLGDNQKALNYYQQALPIRREVGDRGGEATTLNNIGLVWSALGEKHKALDYYQQALPLYQAVGDRGGEANTLNNIGGVWANLGEQHKALDYYQQALPMHRQVGNRTMEATMLNNIGYLYFQNDELERTIEIQKQIIDIFQSIGAVAQEAGCRYNTAFVLQKMGRIEEAIVSVEQGKVILEKYNLPQDASGASVSDYDALLAQLKGDPSPHADEEQTAKIMEAIRAFLNTENWSEARQVYETHEALLSLPIAETIFMQNINQEEDADWRANLQAHLDRIRRAKSEGIAAAFAENPSPPG